MNYREFTVTTFRAGYRNLVGLVLISLLVGLALVPIVAAAVVGTSLALLGGLWTTCLLVGIVVIAGFRFTSHVAERAVPIAVLPAVAAAIRNPTAGLALGAVTFGVVVFATVLVGVSPGGYRPLASGFAAFLLVAWLLLGAFAAPELGSGLGLRPAIRASAARVARSPQRVAWFLVVSFACTLLAGVTVVTLVLFLPGLLALLAARAATGAETSASASNDE